MPDPTPADSDPVDPNANDVPALPEPQVYAAIGEDGFARLCAAFYRRVRVDDLIGPMYPDDDWDGAEQRLRDFLVGRFGGPPRYIQQRGHPRLRMRHTPYPIGLDARHRWVDLMDQALNEANLPDPAVAALRPFFANTATFMMNKDG